MGLLTTTELRSKYNISRSALHDVWLKKTVNRPAIPHIRKKRGASCRIYFNPSKVDDWIDNYMSVYDDG